MLKKRVALLLVIAMTLSFFVQANVFAAPKNRGIEAPTGVKALSITNSSAELKWNAVSGAAGYRVYRAEANDSNYSLIASVTAASYKDSGLKDNTTYWYYIITYNKFATSAESAHIKITTSQLVQPTPEPTPIEPTPTPQPQPAKEVIGFATYYYTGDKSSYNSMVSNSTSLDNVITHTYQTDGLGNLLGQVPTDQIAYANQNGIKVLAMVANNFDGSIAKTLLESSDNRARLIANIQTELAKYGYKGVCIDLEGVYYYNRSQYTAFMSELYAALKPKGYEVTAAVPAKTSDSAANTWSGAYDYPALGQYVDKLILMAYDEHYPGGAAGAVASIGWVDKVAAYAVSVVPKEKLILGVAAYGYDWSANGTKAYSINGVYNLAAVNNAQVKWDDVSKSPYFNYTDSAGVYHSVWFENSESVGYKLEIVNSRGLAGIAIWRLGLENADYWSTINSKLKNN